MSDSNGVAKSPQSDPLSALLERRLGEGQASLPDDDVSRHNLPVLWSFLTRREASGNLSKEPASITIRLGLGSWLVTLSDPSLEVSLTASATALSGCLEQLEVAARSSTAAWAPWRRSRGKFEKVNKPTPGHLGA
jgi:hypothetical protein